MLPGQLQRHGQAIARPASITIALTRAGMPCAGHTNSRAVTTQNATTITAMTAMTRRQARDAAAPPIRGAMAGPESHALRRG